jgi:hypothetical protein
MKIEDLLLLKIKLLEKRDEMGVLLEKLLKTKRKLKGAMS